MLVFSRIKNIETDKELRFKCEALHLASLKHLGVNQYLLLNDETPIMKLARETEMRESHAMRLGNTIDDSKA